jgi:hypothetical protein
LSTRNPVYEHLTRNRRPPSVLWTVIICGILSCIFTLLLLVEWYAMVANRFNPGLPTAWIIIVFSSLVVVFSPSLAAIVTTINTTAVAGNADFVLLKLTGLEPATVVRGHLLASLYWLRIQWAIGFGLLPIVFAANIHILASDLIRTDLTALEIWWDVLPTSLGIVLGGLIIGLSLNWLAICSAIWCSVYNTNRVLAIAVTLMISLCELLLVPTVLGTVIVAAGILYVCGAIGALVIVASLSGALGREILKDTERFI